MITIGTITVALELLVAPAAKLLDAPNPQSATVEASAAKRNVLLKRTDEFMVIHLEACHRTMTVSNYLM